MVTPAEMWRCRATDRRGFDELGGEVAERRRTAEEVEGPPPGAASLRSGVASTRDTGVAVWPGPCRRPSPPGPRSVALKQGAPVRHNGTGGLLPNTLDGQGAAMILGDLLDLVPPAFKGQVDDVRQRRGRRIHEVLRDLTRLRLQTRRRDHAGEASDATTVAIELEAGMPVGMRDRPIREEHRLAAMLSLWEPELAAIEENGAAFLENGVPVIEELESGRAALAGRVRALPEAVALARDLRTLCKDFDLVRWILEVDADVMGTYLPGGSQRGSGRPRIVLYWACIGLIGKAMGVSVRDLAAVVLTHELAHAFTHAGRDIDGHSWATPAYAGCGPYVREGLAQWYTEHGCAAIEDFAPTASAIFEALLDRQPASYREHRSWGKAGLEGVRSAMLQARRQGVVELEEFRAFLASSSKVLRSESVARAGQPSLPGFGEE